MIDNKIKDIVKKIYEIKFPDADCILSAGSVVRGEGTKYSDLDLVVLYKDLKCAYRESFTESGWPIEAFVHDFSTLKYFCIKMDVAEGRPSLPQMVAEGIVLPKETELSRKAKLFVNELLEQGPPPWTDKDFRLKRYLITDKVDDIRDPRSKEEMIATGTQLYSAISDFYFRSKGVWSADGKTIIRKLKEQDSDFHNQFVDAFQRLFEESDPSQVIQLAEKVLEPYGGLLFDGLKLDAPEDWRID